MANSKNIPEYKVCDNPHGIMFFGPGGMDGGANMQCCTALASGNIDFHTNDGNRSVIVNGKYNEVIKGKIPNDQRKGSEKENVARSIVVEDGDLALIAENGNIKIAAKNSNIVGADINELAPIKGFNSYNFLVAKLAYKILAYKYLY